jgi:hypothetical protein
VVVGSALAPTGTVRLVAIAIGVIGGVVALAAAAVAKPASEQAA